MLHLFVPVGPHVHLGIQLELLVMLGQILGFARGPLVLLGWRTLHPRSRDLGGLGQRVKCSLGAREKSLSLLSLELKVLLGSTVLRSLVH